MKFGNFCSPEKLLFGISALVRTIAISLGYSLASTHITAI